MTGDHLDVILKTAQAKAEKDGFSSLPEGATLTFYVAHGGAMLTVSRIEGVRTEGELVFARTAKRETYALARTDIFAIASEGAQGQQPRRAGF